MLSSRREVKPRSDQGKRGLDAVRDVAIASGHAADLGPPSKLVFSIVLFTPEPHDENLIGEFATEIHGQCLLRFEDGTVDIRFGQMALRIY